MFLNEKYQKEKEALCTQMNVDICTSFVREKKIEKKERMKKFIANKKKF